MFLSNVSELSSSNENIVDMSSAVVPPPRVEKVQQGQFCGKWTKEEDRLLVEAVKSNGASKWKRISSKFMDGRRTDIQCLHRWQKVLRPGLTKGPWVREEYEIIIKCIQTGIIKWSLIAQEIPGRMGKQCRERRFNHLDPSIKHHECH